MLIKNFLNCKPLIFLLTVLLLFFFIEGCKINTDYTPTFKGFTLNEKYTENEFINKFSYAKGKDILRLKIINGVDEDSAKKLIKSEILTMEALYGNAISPYPGAISDEIVCDEKFLPQKKDISYQGIDMTYIIAYLSDRLAYGACTDDLSVYKGVVSWTHCKNKNQFRQLEYISIKEAFDENNIEFVKENICN